MQYGYKKPEKVVVEVEAENTGFTQIMEESIGLLTKFEGSAKNAATVCSQFGLNIEKVTSAMGLLNASSKLVFDVLDTGKNNYGDGFKQLKEHIFSLNNEMGSKLTANMVSAQGSLQEFQNTINSPENLGKPFPILIDKFKELTSSIRGSLGSIKQSISDSGGVFSIFKDKVSGMGSSAAGALKNLGQSAVTGMSNLKTSIQNAGGLFPFLATKITSMSLSSIMALNSLTISFLANPIGLAILAIVAAVAAMTVAWKSNFNNIQGYVSSAFGVIKNSVSTLAPVFNKLLAVLKPIGSFLIQYLVVAAAGVVDVFRFLVVTVMSVVNGFMALLTMGKSVWKLLTGDFKGAGEEFNKVKDSVNGIIDDFKNLGENSAVVGVITKSTKELGKEAGLSAEQVKEIGESYKTSLDEAGTRIDNLKSKYSEVAQSASSAFSGEGMEQSTKRFEAAEQIMSRHGDKLTSIKEKVSEQLTAADELSGEEQITQQSKAYSMMIDAASTGGSEMMTIVNANKDMLLSNKTLEGTELTEEQRKALLEQNNVIREGLMEQQEMVVEASKSKLALGQQLTATELKATISATQALYQNKKDQLTANEEEMALLKQQKDETADQVQKANLQQQYDALEFHNDQLKEQQIQAGVDMLTTLQQNEGLKAETVAQGLSGMGELTGQGLADIVSKYSESNISVDEQMALLAGILQSRGLAANESLITALQSGDLASIGGQMSQSTLEGLANLPSELFTKGDAGKQQLIDGLKNGTLEAADVGSLLIGSMNTGISAKQSEVNTNAQNVATGGSNAIKGIDSNFTTSGAGNASAYSGGILKEIDNIKNSGRAIGNAANSGAAEVDFIPTGTNISLGVATGIEQGQGAVGTAMRNLVNFAKNEAEKEAVIKSPSRLFRDTIGKFIAQGVAVGIEEDTDLAVASARNMIDEIQGAVSGSNANTPKAVLTVEHDVQNDLTNRLGEMVETIKNMKVVLESGALVGGIGNQIDGFLGNQAGYAGRYR